MPHGGEHLPALVGWYTASVGNNFATPSLLQMLGDRPLPLNVLEQATMSLFGAWSCTHLRVPLPGLAELRAAGPLNVLCMGVCNAATCFLFMLPLVLTRHVCRHLHLHLQPCVRPGSLPPKAFTRHVYASGVPYGAPQARSSVAPQALALAATAQPVHDYPCRDASRGGPIRACVGPHVLARAVPVPVAHARRLRTRTFDPRTLTLILRSPSSKKLLPCLALPCLAWLPILGGFALAVNAQGSSSLPGVAAALGSLLALNGVQHCSRACSVRGLHDVQAQRTDPARTY